MYSDSHVRAWIKAFSWKSLKRKDPDKRPVFVQEWEWNRITSDLDNRSTFHTGETDETTALSPCPTQAPKFSNSCCLNTSTNSKGTLRVGFREEHWQEQSFVIQSKGNKAAPEGLQQSGPSWAPYSPPVNPQSLSSKLLNHFTRHYVPICWWETSHSSLQPSFPYFPLLNALLPMTRQQSDWLSLGNWRVSQPTWKVTFYLGSNPRLSKDAFLFLKDHKDSGISLPRVNNFSRSPPTATIPTGTSLI